MLNEFRLRLVRWVLKQSPAIGEMINKSQLRVRVSIIFQNWGKKYNKRVSCQVGGTLLENQNNSTRERERERQLRGRGDADHRQQRGDL